MEFSCIEFWNSIMAGKTLIVQINVVCEHYLYLQSNIIRGCIVVLIITMKENKQQLYFDMCYPYDFSTQSPSSHTFSPVFLELSQAVIVKSVDWVEYRCFTTWMTLFVLLNRRTRNAFFIPGNNKKPLRARSGESRKCSKILKPHYLAFSTGTWLSCALSVRRRNSFGEVTLDMCNWLWIIFHKLP